MVKTRRRFDRQFKLKSVELSYSRDNVRELADELSIRPELLYRWRGEFGSSQGTSFPGNGIRKMTDEESQIMRLKKELANMQMERDILKKAVGIFSRSDGKHFNS